MKEFRAALGTRPAIQFTSVLCGIGLAACLSLAATRGWAAQEPPERSSCEVCHSEEAVAYRNSAHAKTGMTCVDCHGGDPQDMNATAMAKAKGFKGSPKHSEVPTYCAGCHSNRERMRPYGLRADELEEYETSMHGKRWRKGDPKVAVCTDCHSAGKDKGRHDLLPITDPAATVYPKNVHRTCGRCHSDAKRMAEYGIATDQDALYQESVHGKALLLGGNEKAATCTSCHGNHGALPPGMTDIASVCGQCHRPVRDLVRASVHGKLAKKEAANGNHGTPRFRECTSCHGEGDGGGHGISHPTPELLDTVCVKCHSANEDALVLGGKIKGHIIDADKALEEARAKLAEGRELGFVVGAWQAIIDKAQTDMVQARLAQHVLALNDVEKHTQAVETARDQIADEIGRRVEAVNLRKLSVFGIWGYVLLSCALFYWKKRRVDRQYELEHAGKSEGA